jgi:tetratricopeptide (TPR) repeat protein
LWARAESADALVSSYVTLATLLRLPEREAKEQEVMVQAVKSWLQTHPAWLLILDNADDLAVLPTFLPSALAGHLLLTTRAAATGRLAQRLEIETLPSEQGALFLLRRAALLAPNADLSHVASLQQELARQISEELGGLPLALDQAGAYLEETGCGLSDYQQMYWQHRDKLLRKRGGLVADHPESVAATWSLSFQQAQEKHPAAADLLRVCAFLAPDAIPEEILTAGASSLGPVLAPVVVDPFRLNQALEALRAYSLIRRNPTEKTLSIHRLVQAVLQETLLEEERHTWRERAMLAVNAAFPHGKPETWPMCERLLSHALLAAQFIKQDQMIEEEAGRLLYETASYLQDRVRSGEAELLYQHALHIRKQQWGSEHPEVATVLGGLARHSYFQRKLVAAESFEQRALHIREQQLGSEHHLVAHSLHNLAAIYHGQGKREEAELLYQRALHIWEQQLGPEHPEVAYALNGLAYLYSDQGKYGKAELFYQRAVHIWEQQEHSGEATALRGLANLYSKQGKYEEAEPLYQRAVHIWEQQLGREHPDVARGLSELASLYSEQGKYELAEPLYQRALRIWKLDLGSEHIEVAYPLNNLANLYWQQGKYAEAEPLYQRALHNLEQELGPEHRDTADTIHDLARFWETQGNSEEARACYARALAVREQALGAHHPTTMETRTRFIALLHAMGQHEEAAQFEDTQPKL